MRRRLRAAVAAVWCRDEMKASQSGMMVQMMMMVMMVAVLLLGGLPVQGFKTRFAAAGISRKVREFSLRSDEGRGREEPSQGQVARVGGDTAAGAGAGKG